MKRRIFKRGKIGKGNGEIIRQKKGKKAVKKMWTKRKTRKL